MSEISLSFSKEKDLFENFIQDLFKNKDRGGEHCKKLYESMAYSAESGGKRFRPVLSLLVSELFEKSAEVVLPFAAGVELIHTYSLIHDDLPMMDDDSERRGQPTNHVVFGEVTALLAGDALQGMAFEVAAKNSAVKPELVLQSVLLLAKACGAEGMVGGQAIDIALLKGSKTDLKELELMQSMKTGALIRVAVEGAAVLSGANQEEQVALKTYGESLGLSFQLADDLLDYDSKSPEKSGWPCYIGVEKTKEKLKQSCERALKSIEPFGKRAQRLAALAEYNLNRTY